MESAASEYAFVSMISPVQVAGATLHCIFLFFVLAFAVATGWGRKYEGLDGKLSRTPYLERKEEKAC